MLFRSNIQTAESIKDDGGLSGLIDIVSQLWNAVDGGKALRNLASFLANPFVFITAIGGLLTWISTNIATDPNFIEAFRQKNDPTGMLGAMSGDAGFAASILGAAARNERVRSQRARKGTDEGAGGPAPLRRKAQRRRVDHGDRPDRKSTRLNSSHT